MQLFAELKRRGVVQVGVAYMVTSWLLVQVAGTVFPAFDTPAWVMRALFILLTVGFPITLLISWVFDLTSHGLIRTPDASLDSPANSKRSGFANMITIGILAAAVILFALDKFYWKSDLLPAARPQTEVVAVLPFQNMNNEASNDAFTLGVHEDLLTQLSKIRVFRTLSRTSVSRYMSTQNYQSLKSQRSWARVSSWRVACSAQKTGFASIHNWSMVIPTATCGPKPMIAN